MNHGIAGAGMAALLIATRVAAIDIHQAAPIEIHRSASPEVVAPPPAPAVKEAGVIHVVEPPAAPRIIPSSPPRGVEAARPMQHPGGMPAEAQDHVVAQPPGGNPIEPISNGIALDMTRDEVKRRFGEPGRRAGYPSCVMHFPDFTAETCYGEKRVSRLYLNGPGARLSSGLGVGSRRAEVARVLGSPAGGQLGPYTVGVTYNGDRVSGIKIDHEPTRADHGAENTPSGAASGLIGTYRGINGTAGVLELRADGSYLYQGRPMGQWQASGDGVAFTGQVFAHAGNRAALKSGGKVLMFRLGPAGQWYARVK